jgi:hypothetical protein
MSESCVCVCVCFYVDKFSNFQFTISGMHHSLAKQDKLKQVIINKSVSSEHSLNLNILTVRKQEPRYRHYEI